MLNVPTSSTGSLLILKRVTLFLVRLVCVKFAGQSGELESVVVRE